MAHSWACNPSEAGYAMGLVHGISIARLWDQPTSELGPSSLKFLDISIPTLDHDQEAAVAQFWVAAEYE